MPRWLSTLLLANALLYGVIGAHELSGCAAAIPLIHQIATVVAQVTGVVDLIESQARSASEAGLLPPDVARRITALRVAIVDINDAAQASPAVYEAAVARFERLYAELLPVVAPLGVRPKPLDGRLGAAREPGTVMVPTSGELGELLREPR